MADRRDVRREILEHLGVIEKRLQTLEALAAKVDNEGDPILADDFRRQVTAFLELVDKMHLWAGDI